MLVLVRWASVPTLATMTLPGVIRWRSLTSGTLSIKGGRELLEKAPTHPRPKRPLALPTPGECRVPLLLVIPPGAEQQLKKFPHHPLVPTPPHPHQVAPPHLTILCLHHPPKHNVAVPIKKVDGGAVGGQPCWGQRGNRMSPQGGGWEGVPCGGGVRLKKRGQHRMSPGTIAEHWWCRKRGG